MYVAELDRPWRETPFLFQGFEIHGEEELAQLRSLCQYVYVLEEGESAATIQNKRTKAAPAATAPVTAPSLSLAATTAPAIKTLPAIKTRPALSRKYRRRASC